MTKHARLHGQTFCNLVKNRSGLLHDTDTKTRLTIPHDGCAVALHIP